MSRLLNARELGDMLGLTPGTVLAWTRERKLPAIKLPSGQVRYRRDEVEAWLDGRRVGVESSGLHVINGGANA